MLLLLLQSSGLNPKPPDARQGFSYHRAQMFSSHSHHYCHHHRHQSCPSAILYPHEVRVFWLLPPILSYSLPSPICIPSSLLVLSSDSSPFFHKHFEFQSYCGLKLTLSPGRAVTEFSISLPLPSKQQGFQADSNTPGPLEAALTKECFASLSNLRSR